MADDLGDSHLQSLKQGGRLPDYSTAQRTVGRIYADAGKGITYKVFPEVNGRTQNIALYNTSGTMVSDVTGTSSSSTPLTGSYTPGSSSCELFDAVLYLSVTPIIALPLLSNTT